MRGDIKATIDGCKAIMLVLLRCRGRLDVESQAILAAKLNPQAAALNASDVDAISRNTVFLCIRRLLWVIVQVPPTHVPCPCFHPLRYAQVGESDVERTYEVDVETFLEWVKSLADSGTDAGAADILTAIQRLKLYLVLYEVTSHLTMAKPGVWSEGIPN